MNRLFVLAAIPVLIGMSSIAPTVQAQQNQPSDQAPQQQTTGNKKPGKQRPRPPRLDLKSAAKKLGVTEQALAQALGLPAQPPKAETANQRPAGPPPRPDFAAAAQKLGVSEQALIEALGVPPRPPGDRPNQAPNQTPDQPPQPPNTNQ